MTTEAQTEAKVEEVKDEIAEVKAEIADPGTSDNEKAALEKRLDTLDSRMDKLIEKLDTLASRPFAPAPAAKETQPEEKTVEKAEEPKAKQHRFGASWFFGERSYED